MLRTALLSTKQATTRGLSSVKIGPKQSSAFFPSPLRSCPHKWPTQQVRQQYNYISRSRQSSRSRSGETVVFALIAANVAVTIGWIRAESTQSRYREQHLRIFSPSVRTMLAHFTTSTQHLKEGRYYTLLTAVFSQATISHLATNMIGLYFFGSQLCDVLGHRKFLGLYLTSGVLSSAVAVLEQKSSGRFSFNLGASGAVNGITTMSILLNPHGKLYLLALIPLPAWLAGSLFILRDTYAFVTDQQDGIGHVAHLSGAFVGGVYYFYLRRRSFRRF